jgi:hypothetical protein
VIYKKKVPAAIRYSETAVSEELRTVKKFQGVNGKEWLRLLQRISLLDTLCPLTRFRKLRLCLT